MSILWLLLHPSGEHAHEFARAVGYGEAPFVDVGKAAQVQVLNDRFNALSATNDQDLHRFAAGAVGWGAGTAGRKAE